MGCILTVYELPRVRRTDERPNKGVRSDFLLLKVMFRGDILDALVGIWRCLRESDCAEQ